MSEIYWIQRIGALSDLFNVMWGISMVIEIVALLCFPVIVDYFDDYKDKIIKVCKILIATFIVGVIGGIFIPTTNELYAIYGIGGTIDYIKSNDKAKQLPDKVVDALTRYVDNIEKEDKDNNNE